MIVFRRARFGAPPAGPTSRSGDPLVGAAEEIQQRLGGNLDQSAERRTGVGRWSSWTSRSAIVRPHQAARQLQQGRGPRAAAPGDRPESPAVPGPGFGRVPLVWIRLSPSGSLRDDRDAVSLEDDGQPAHRGSAGLTRDRARPREPRKPSGRGRTAGKMGPNTDHSGQDQKQRGAGQQPFSRSNANVSR